MIKIGVIAKPQGIKGELKLFTENSADRYIDLESVYIDDVEKKISSIVARGGFIYLQLEGVTDRNSAELLRGKEVFVKEEILGDLKENEFYFKDLIGCSVFDEQENKIGELVDIEQYGAADVISINERNIIFSVPFIDEIFISVTPKKIIIKREEYDNIKISD